MLDVRRLRLLHDLSHLGTIAAVAQAHTYTPSAVSQQLAALEREAGTALLARSGRGVTLTEAGRVLAAGAVTVLAALENAQAALAGVAAGLTGPLRIGAYPSAARTLLVPALVTLARDHPGLELRVTELDPAAVPAALLDRTLDVGLLTDYDVVPSAPDPALDTTALLDERVYLAVPTDFRPGPAASAETTRTPGHARTRSPAGETPGGAGPVGETPGGAGVARDRDWILAGAGTLCHTATLHVCAAAGFLPRARHHADDFTTVLALVAAGQGVSLVPELAAAHPPPGVRLIALPTRRRTRIACRRGAGTHPAITAFTAALRAGAAAFPAL